jgi:NADP-dependent aldehyde dehydrogenase
MFDAFQVGIFNSCRKHISTLRFGKAPEGLSAVESVILHTSVEEFNQNPHLSEEIFGPTSLVVEANSKEEILSAAHNLNGHLTATVHGTDEDFAEYTDLLEILEQKVGRILLNGFPTGVEVSHAMVHGGPFPATTDSRSTSVGTMAITRFTRPVCYQNYPDVLLPFELKSDNPLSIWRLVDGEMKK